MTALTITDAVAGFAAARCLAARVRDAAHRTTLDHPTRCGWCDYPTDVLDEVVRRVNDLVGFDRRNGTNATGILTFERLDRDEQRAAVTSAQELEAAAPAPTTRQELDPSPADAAPPPPAWLGGTS